MKKKLLLSALLFSGLVYAQTCENIKSENANLKSEIQSVKTENDYLKKILEINTPILEYEKDNNNFRITKVTGNKADKTITITYLVEAKDVDKNLMYKTFPSLIWKENYTKVILINQVVLSQNYLPMFL